MNRYLKLFEQLVVSLTLLLIFTACGSQSSGGDSSSPVAPGNNNSGYADKVSISQVSTMPTVEGVQSGQTFYVVAFNDTANRISLTNLNVTNLNSAKNLIKSTKASSSGFVNDVIDASQCAVVNPQQICLIAVKPNSKEGRFLLKLNFLTSQNKSYTSSQLISFANISQNGGFSYSTNNLDIVDKLHNKVYVAIPFVLNMDFKDVKVTSSVQPIYQSDILCGAGKYTKNNSCTVLMGFETNNFTNKINITGTNSSGAKYSASLFSQVTYNNVANVITDAVNLSVKANESPVVFHLYNAGINNASSITFTPESVAISLGDTSSCSTLAVGDSCEISVATNTTSVGSTNVKISYFDGTANQELTFHVVYYPEPTLPGSVALNVTTVEDNFASDINSSKIINLVIENKSTKNVAITDIKPTDASSLPQFFSYDQSSITNGTACNIAGFSLNKGESCILAVKYDPQLIDTSEKTFNIFVHGMAEGVSYTASSVSLRYSAYSITNNLVANPASANLDIRADNKDLASQTINLTNPNLDQSVRVDFVGTVSPVAISANSCTGNEILPNSQCSFTVSYGVSSASESGQINLVVRSTALATHELLPDLNIPVSFKATPAALIKVTLESTPVYSVFGGYTLDTGLVTPAYTFYSSLGNVESVGYIALKYTFENIGMIAANNFQFAANELPLGFFVDNATTTCSANGSQVLQDYSNPSSNSCNVVVGFVDSSYFKYFSNNTAVLGILPSTLSFSYNDANTGLNRGTTGVSSQITANNWAQVDYLTPTIDSLNRTLTLQFKVVALAPSVSSINIPADFLGDGFTGGSACSGKVQGDVCVMTFNYNLGLPAGTYQRKITVNPTSNGAVFPAFEQLITFVLP